MKKCFYRFQSLSVFISQKAAKREMCKNGIGVSVFKGMGGTVGRWERGGKDRG